MQLIIIFSFAACMAMCYGSQADKKLEAIQKGAKATEALLEIEKSRVCAD